MGFKSEIKVSAFKRNKFDAVDLVIWRPLDEERIVVYRENDDGDWAWSEDLASNDVRPSLRVPGSFHLNVLQNIVDEIKEQFGIKATADKVHKNELEATREHLKDMRTLLFKSDWIELQNGSPAVEMGGK